VRRTKVIAGNWKMNNTVEEASGLVEGLKQELASSTAEIVVGVPFVCIPSVKEILKDSNIKVSAQNMHWEEKGAFTGEISPRMLCALGVDYVIIGHSERRQYFGETDETINKKLQSAAIHNLIPIVCVGETLEQREKNVTEEIIRYQVKMAFSNIDIEHTKNVIIAYEPIWAIGTGKTATSDQANEVCFTIRETIGELYNSAVADAMTILYGGSVNAANAQSLFSKPDIDGALVGGASLKLDEFRDIVKAANLR